MTETLYKCAGASCPGLPYKASDRRHPEACAAPMPFADLALAERSMDESARKPRGPLRKLTADMCDDAPESVLRAALRLALQQSGDYQSTEPARLLARLIEDAFAGCRPTVAQLERVRAAVEAEAREAKANEDAGAWMEAFVAVSNKDAAMAMVAPTVEPTLPCEGVAPDACYEDAVTVGLVNEGDL